jgi:phage shock protein B
MHHNTVPIFAVLVLFIGLPWLVFHYVTKWKTAPKLTNEDERLLDELYALARRCDERLGTVERIMAAENPNWRAVACDTPERALAAPEDLDDIKERMRRIK